MMDLSVSLGRLRLPNPILVASGTFGYAREMQGIIDLSRLGGIIPKTVTRNPRRGNAPWRTVETPAGLLNSIGLDNDGIEYFLREHLPYLRDIGPPVIVSVAGKNQGEFLELVESLEGQPGVAAVELNLSCPNVSGGVDFGTDPSLCEQVVAASRKASGTPLIAKLTPNVTDIKTIAKSAEQGGADAISAINTCLGMAVHWRSRRPVLGNVVGGLSGPAIKPIALRCVYQIRSAVRIPVIGVGGIATIDDVMDFLVTGASMVQVGTANFYNPRATMDILDALPSALREIGSASVQQAVGTLKTDRE